MNLLKLELIDQIFSKTHTRLELADAEVKSTYLRVLRERKKSQFLSQLSGHDLTRVHETFIAQIPTHHMRLFSVVIDKRKLHDYMDETKLHRKAYELLLERIERFLANYHHKHQAVIVVDDTSREMNRALAMKHSYFLRDGTGATKLRHIVEMPFFTASNLSNGVQLADLCAYNVYAAFRYDKPDWPHFQRLLPHFYNSHLTPHDKLDGIKIFPPDSDLVDVLSRATACLKQEGPPLTDEPSAK